VDIGAISGVAAAVIAVGSLAGTSLRVGRQQTTVNNYRETALSWEAKARAQAAEIDELKAQNTDLLAKVTKQEGEMASLRDLVTGRQALLDIQADIHKTAEDLAHQTISRGDFNEWREEVRTQLAEIRRRLDGPGGQAA
jgi:chromosome segregation ATPase